MIKKLLVGPLGNPSIKRDFSRIPKLDLTQRSGGLFGIFQSKYLDKSVFNLSHEVTDFFRNNREYLVQEFPFIGSDDDILINFACLHFLILKERLVRDDLVFLKP